MNKWIGIGRLTGDPESTTSTNGTAYARFNIAVDRKFKKEGEPTADFFGCVAFGKQAEFVSKYLHKGTKISVVGRFQNDEYVNNKGEKVRTTKVMIEEIEFAESKSEAPKEAKNDFINVPEGLVEELPFS